MKRSTLIWLAVLLLPLPLVPRMVRNIRSVIPYSASEKMMSTRFDAGQSVALFVGISSFLDTTLMRVPFAADDAVDLAYAFTLGANTPLVPVDRIIVAISDNPTKKESMERLRKLEAAGARIVRKVDQPTLLTLLRDQGERAGRDGLFIVSFATHGFNNDGVAHLLGESSLFRDPETTLSAAKVADIVGQSDAARSLIFIDACRERVNIGTRAGSREPAAAAPLISAMRKVAGQVIFYAAADGGYAYDDPDRGNGVFTASIIESMNCSAGKKRLITVGQLADDVESKVRAWVRKHREPILKATQISTEGSTDRMPLMDCSAPMLAQGIGEFRSLSSVTFTGSTLIARDERGEELWRRTTPGAIRKAITDELFYGNAHGVVALSNDAFVSVYDDAGKLISTYHHAGSLRDVAIVRATRRHNPKIVVTGRDAPRGVAAVAMLEPKKATVPFWYGVITPAAQRIDRFEVSARVFTIHTSAGGTIHLDFDGHRTDLFPGSRSAQFTLIEP
jgi:hypothetical protein